jgi:hypothetical protein
LKYTLSLKKETLAELTSDELRTAIGGVGVASGSCTSCACSCTSGDHSCNDAEWALATQAYGLRNQLIGGC